MYMENFWEAGKYIRPTVCRSLDVLDKEARQGVKQVGQQDEWSSTCVHPTVHRKWRPTGCTIALCAPNRSISCTQQPCGQAAAVERLRGERGRGSVAEDLNTSTTGDYEKRLMARCMRGLSDGRIPFFTTVCEQYSEPRRKAYLLVRLWQQKYPRTSPRPAQVLTVERWLLHRDLVSSLLPRRVKGFSRCFELGSRTM